MSALRVVQISGILLALLAVASVVVSDRSTTSFVLGGGQLLAGICMAVGARVEERSRKG